MKASAALLIPSALYENVDDKAVLVHRPPQPVPSAVDLQRYFVQADLRRALEQHEFVVHYQPVLALADERIIGVEALVR